MTEDDEGVRSDSDESPIQGQQDEFWWSQLDLTQLIRSIEQYVSHRYTGMSPHDAEEIATEAVLRVIQATKAGRLTLEGDPTAYISAVARNLVADRSRKWARHAEVPVASFDSLDQENPENNAIAAFINQDAAADVVQRALAAARADGDHTTYRVITFVLDETERSGHLPSNREVADHLGLSHTGVAKSLARFRRILQRDEGKPD